MSTLFPDLDIQFSNIKLPTLFPDELGRVGVIVTNQGEARLQGPLTINLYASTDEKLDDPRPTSAPLPNPVLGEPGNDELLGRLSPQTVNLKPGQSKTFTLDFTTPEFRTASVVSPGAYYLFADVVPGNTVTESNKDNNLASEFVSADGSDVVLDWNATLLNAIQAAKGLTQEPPFAARNSAIVHAAIFDAVNAIDQSFDPYLVNIDASDPRIVNASPDAAAVEAAYQTLVALYPSQQAAFDNQRTRSLAEIPDGEFEDKGVALGGFVSEQILAARSNDGSTEAQVPFPDGDEPGEWRRTPTRNPETNFAPALLPEWGEVDPFAIPSVEAIIPDSVNGPPAVDSAEYAAELEEVRMKGGLQDTAVTTITRTEEETEIAKFWSYDREDTFRPQGQWNELAQEVALEQGTTLAETARLFALLNIAEADASIATWDLKYEFNQWRPITAINEAAVNPYNPGVVGDAEWQPLLDTPAFPDYISGHATFGGASAAVLTALFGKNYSFEIPSQELGGEARSFSSFMDAAQENALSRLYGGIHVRSSSEDGLAVGTTVGNYVFNNILTPVPV